MKLLFLSASVLFSVSALSIVLVFIFSPALVFTQYLITGGGRRRRVRHRPTISLVIVVRNAAALIRRKIVNSLALDYPSESLEIIVFSDGSSDATEQEVAAVPDRRITFLSSARHEGKNAAINAAVTRAVGELVVLTDADALLEEDALSVMADCFSDPLVGGVSGSIAFQDESGKLKKAQSVFMGFDSVIKHFESQTGSISSKTGKISAIRRSLFRPLPEAVADDMYIPLSIVKQRKRFVYEERARAFIRVSSRNPRHEIERRRRIVTRSLTAIFSMKELLNPLRHGLFSLNLLINKVVRRFLPVSLLLFFVSSVILSFPHKLFLVLAFGQAGFYLLALSSPFFERRGAPARWLGKASSVAYYFCLGNYGTLLGLIDFLTGKRVAKWNPVKTDA